MAHLTCIAHNKRSLVLGKKVVHRSDTDHCPSLWMLWGDKVILKAHLFATLDMWVFIGYREDCDCRYCTGERRAVSRVETEAKVAARIRKGKK